MYSFLWFQGLTKMRRAAINGAVFLFLARGETLQKKDIFPCNGVPDERYVLWPRGDLWDVRYYNRQTNEMLAIADAPFSDESAAWLAAFAHREALSEKSQISYCKNDEEYDEVYKRIPVINN